jgi:hypothetical protein
MGLGSNKIEDKFNRLGIPSAMKLNKFSFAALAGLLICASVILIYDNYRVHATNSDAINRIRILFIGNSYTFVNNLPKVLESLASHEARSIETVSVTEGGATLKKHWQDGKALAAIRKGHWNYVVLQEHSTFGSTTVINNVAQLNDPADFYTYARLFDAEIKKVGAKTLFYMTWARQNAPQNQAIIAKTYAHIAEELHDEVVPVGLAWGYSLKANPEVALHQVDKSHPNPDGTYLAACVFYATLYHKNPVGLVSYNTSNTGSPPLVDKQDAIFLQKLAWQTVAQSEQPVRPLNIAISKSLP